MYRILLNDEIDLHEWNTLLNDSCQTTFFQSPECYSFYKKNVCFDAFIIGLKFNEKLIAIASGYIPKSKNKINHYFSRRAIIPGGILFYSEISKQDIVYFLDTINKYFANKVIYLEIRNYIDYSSCLNDFVQHNFRYIPYLNYHIDTESYEKTWNNIHKSKKRQIKKSIHTGLVSVLTSDIQDIQCLYKILQELYTKQLKLPLFPVEFFINLSKEDWGKIIVIKENNEVLGGIVCISWKNSMYEWFVCGKKDHALYPSVLATWAGIEYAVNNNHTNFDFLGAGKPNQDYGVREFKSKFGGNLVEYGRFLRIYNPILYIFSKFVLKIYQSLSI